MKLLVADRSSVAGGAEKLCVSLFPELARLGASIVWALPSHRIGCMEALLPADHGIIFESIDWPPWNFRRWLSAALRRFGGKRTIILRNLLHTHRIAWLQQKYGAHHVLYPWIQDEPLSSGGKASMSIIIYDRNWTCFPENFLRSQESMDRHMERWLASCDRAFAISGTVREDVSRAWPQYAGKIHSVPLAMNPHLDRNSWERTEAGDRRDKIFYYPATVSPHKGHVVLLTAAQRLLTKGYRFKLILSGHGTLDMATNSNKELRESFAHCCALDGDAVEGMGYADGGSVERFYMRADCVVIPSLYEGFGLPLAEALGHGARVICTDLPSHREQIGRFQASRAVTQIPAGNVEALVEAMCAELDKPRAAWEEREEISRITGRWTWQDTAAAYYKILNES